MGCVYIFAFAIARHFCASYGELKMNEIEKLLKWAVVSKSVSVCAGGMVFQLRIYSLIGIFFLFNHAKMHE